MKTFTCQQLLVEPVEERWEDYLRALAGVGPAFSSKTVKGLRRALRRLLATLNLLNRLTPQPSLQHLCEACQAQLDGLGELRDAQVTLAEVNRNACHYLALQAWQPLLREREQQLRLAAAEDLATFALAPLDRQRRQACAQLAAAPLPDAPAALLQAVDKAYHKVLKRQAELNPAVIASFHRLRLALKRFRYLLELAQPLTPAYPAAQLQGLRQYQRALGALQDADVFLRHLNAFAATLPEPRTAVARAAYANQHAQRLADFIQLPSPLAGAWRPATDEPFPWVGLRKVTHLA